MRNITSVEEDNPVLEEGEALLSPRPSGSFLFLTTSEEPVEGDQPEVELAPSSFSFCTGTAEEHEEIVEEVFLAAPDQPVQFLAINNKLDDLLSSCASSASSTSYLPMFVGEATEQEILSSSASFAALVCEEHAEESALDQLEYYPRTPSTWHN